MKNIERQNKEMLKDWHDGKSIVSIEMGGMGEDYERVIQLTAIMLVEKFVGVFLPFQSGAVVELFHEQIGVLCRQSEGAPEWIEGMSGAQAAAAFQIAYKALTLGWKGMENTIPSDRRLIISKGSL